MWEREDFFFLFLFLFWPSFSSYSRKQQSIIVLSVRQIPSEIILTVFFSKAELYARREITKEHNLCDNIWQGHKEITLVVIYVMIPFWYCSYKDNECAGKLFLVQMAKDKWNDFIAESAQVSKASKENEYLGSS